ncbi:xanthine dehydrogenase accessory protein XdhC [Haliea sp. E17]|uniref:xanthine dehydrogenase accessory protein XdhC n=1 Tax=Haliea sp. E17 TaxID=3401576 RepID=UPI003AB01F8D
MSMNRQHWSEAVATLERAGAPYVLATVIATAGSTPRERGAKMVITASDTFASIGGGQLEYLVVEQARETLRRGEATQEIRQFPLAAEARQCCGGSVALLLESFVPALREVCIFGAGHVARALAEILVQTDTRVTCIDNRPELLAEMPAADRLVCRLEDDPVAAIGHLPGHAHMLVLTHDHALDYRLVGALLAQGGWRSLGLIGSETKSLRFRHRLGKDGFSAGQLARLDCPVGVPGVRGKAPMEVAVSIAAALLADGDTQAPASAVQMSWPQMRKTLREVEQTCEQ